MTRVQTSLEGLAIAADPVEDEIQCVLVVKRKAWVNITLTLVASKVLLHLRSFQVAEEEAYSFG